MKYAICLLVFGIVLLLTEILISRDDPRMDTRNVVLIWICAALLGVVWICIGIRLFIPGA